ncbi:MAG: arginine N-succinyltransferase [Betaproteobacteria bacterium]|nr:arginine N-succinyltransferase [Betaproteobacteria bacterium]
MIIIRTVTEGDLEALFALATEVDGGMTTFKADREALTRRIETACASFGERIAQTQRDYVFVLEDLEAGRLAGVCAIKAAVGLEEPFYNYRIGTLVHSSRELKVFSRMDTLYLSNDLTGCAELCSLFLHPEYRQGNNGKLLSKSRFLFMAQFARFFPERLIAELRGYQRPDGTSPFWESLGRHFFKMDFARADDLTAVGKKSFIAELMPRHPLYVAYLTPEAQEVIGKVHVQTAPAQRLLEQEGMHYEGYIDIFDSGPVLQARVSELRALRESRLLTVSAGLGDAEGDALLVANTRLTDFRVLATPGRMAHGHLELPPAALRALGGKEGDALRVMRLLPRRG